MGGGHTPGHPSFSAPPGGFLCRSSDRAVFFIYSSCRHWKPPLQRRGVRGGAPHRAIGLPPPPSPRGAPMSIKPPQYFLRPPPPPTALGVGGGGELRGGAAAPQRAAARGRAAARPGGHLGALRGCRGPPGSARYRARPRRGHVRRRHVGPARRYGGRCGPKVPGERRAGAEGSLRFFFLSLFFFFCPPTHKAAGEVPGCPGAGTH